MWKKISVATYSKKITKFKLHDIKASIAYSQAIWKMNKSVIISLEQASYFEYNSVHLLLPNSPLNQLRTLQMETPKYCKDPVYTYQLRETDKMIHPQTN
jgi:hypothetical protein